MFTNNITSGGQTTLHKVRMWGQVLRRALLFSFLVAVGYWGVQVYQHTYEHQYSNAIKWGIIEISSLDMLPNDLHPTFDLDHPRLKKPLTLKAKDFVKHQAVHFDRKWVVGAIKYYFLRAIGVFFLTLFLILAFFAYKGRRHKKSKMLYGKEILTGIQFKWYLRSRLKASALNINSMPLIKNRETQHMLLTGTTGAGKSSAIHNLLPTIRRRGDKAVIVDVNGEFVERYYRPGHDILLNPFDERNSVWNLKEDLFTHDLADVFVNSFIQKESTYSDPFWTDGSRVILREALGYLEDGTSLQEIVEQLLRESSKGYEKLFKGTDAGHLTAVAGDKTTASLRSHLVTYTKILRHIVEGEEGVSLAKWVNDTGDDRWLFLCLTPDKREAFSPLLSSWIDILVTQTLRKDSHEFGRKTWFVLDELPVIRRVPMLQVLLAEGRKFDACVLAGIQSITQISGLYGKDDATNMLNLFNTKIFFRTTDVESREWISKLFGENEIKEKTEGLSFGANEIRDGVNMAEHRLRNRNIRADEISSLENLSFYALFHGPFPIVKWHASTERPEKSNEKFIAKIVR